MRVRLLGLWSYIGESGSSRAGPLLVLPRVDFTYGVDSHSSQFPMHGRN